MRLLVLAALLTMTAATVFVSHAHADCGMFWINEQAPCPGCDTTFIIHCVGKGGGHACVRAVGFNLCCDGTPYTVDSLGCPFARTPDTWTKLYLAKLESHAEFGLGNTEKTGENAPADCGNGRARLDDWLKHPRSTKPRGR